MLALNPAVIYMYNTSGRSRFQVSNTTTYGWKLKPDGRGEEEEEEEEPTTHVLSYTQSLRRRHHDCGSRCPGTTAIYVSGWCKLDFGGGAGSGTGAQV